MKMFKFEIPHDDFRGERAKLRKFVSTYRDLPVLWDVKCMDYTKKDKRNRGYEVLLEVYRTIKEDATIDDVKKKINSMRSNFRKELKKVSESANAGMEYRPSSWMYEELMFLKDLETHLHWTKSQFVAPEENEIVHNSEANRVETDTFPNYPQYSNKRPKYIETNQNQQHESQHIVDSMCANERDIARVWASKLKTLDNMQRLFAEKAINDVLFEAQLGTLHRNSVKINEYHMPAVVNSPLNRDYHQRYEPSQSSPEYKYSDTDVFRADDN